MLLVIFGAGASYDSAPTYPPGSSVQGAGAGAALDEFYRPPLADRLFANRPAFAAALGHFAECQPIVPRLRHLYKETVEEALEDLQVKAKTYPRGVQQLIAVRYYLQEILLNCSTRWNGTTQGVTNYKTLLDQIERAHKGNESVCLVTFNYDTLLEDALTGFDLPIKSMADYTKGHPFYRMFKLHGSVNWARLLRNNIEGPNPYNPSQVAREWIRRAMELNVSDDYVVWGGSPIAVADGKPAIPAIAIPVGKGKIFECPHEQVEKLRELLPLTTKVLVIGWRAAEEHFLRLLREHLPAGISLYIVSGSAADAEETRLRINRALEKKGPAHINTNANGFSDFILSRQAEIFLRQREPGDVPGELLGE